MMKVFSDSGALHVKQSIVHALFGALHNCGTMNNDVVPLVAGLQSVC